jgi:hypothetical protein
LPAWDATISQLPAETRVTVVPDTVQTNGVREAKLTVNPELAVALTVKGVAPYVTAGRVAKVMVCGMSVTAKVCFTVVAAQPLLPAWDAAMVQFPVVTKVAVVPETVQTSGVVEAKLTVSPELAVALRLTDPVDSVVAGFAVKVMV